MALLEKMLGQGRYNNITVNSVYTVPVDTRSGIAAIQLCNTTNTDVPVQLYFVPSGSIAGPENAILYDFVIPANDYHSFSPERPHYLSAGDQIAFQNGTANGVTITASGIEIS